MSSEEPPSLPPASGALATLTPNQKLRLQAVTDAMAVEKITISHSIDVWQDGRKMNAFYSVSTGCRNEGGFTPEDTRLARLILGKHVVASVYDDAVKRGMMTASAAQEEARTVTSRYDAGIAKLLNRIEGQ